MRLQSESPPTIYSICLQRIIDESWVRALHINPIATHRHYVAPAHTILTLQLADQAVLIGLLNQFHNMGLIVLSVQMNLEPQCK